MKYSPKRGPSPDDTAGEDYNRSAKNFGIVARHAYGNHNYQAASRNYALSGRALFNYANAKNLGSTAKVRILEDTRIKYILARDALNVALSKSESNDEKKDLIEKRRELNGTLSGLESALRVLSPRGRFSSLEVFPALAILTLLAALFFLSFNFTGAVIGNAAGSMPSISPQGSLWIGLGLIIAGVALALVYFREKDSEKKSLVRKGSARRKK